MSLPQYHYPLHVGQNPPFGKTCFLIGHIGLVLGIYEVYKLGLCWETLGLMIAGIIYEHMGGIGITAGAHRMWSHKSYSGNDLYRFIVMLFNCISFQGELLYWCIDHRAHHKWSDTRRDPHNSLRGFWFSHMGWLLLPRDPLLIEALSEIPFKDLMNDWVIVFQLRWYPLLVLIIRIIIPTMIGHAITDSYYIGFVVSTCAFWCQSLHHTFLVNSAAHMKDWGYRPYDRDINPNESAFVIYAAAGEGHHNFHHAFPRDYATSELDWTDTYNPTKRFIDLAASFGMIYWRMRSKYNEKEKRWISRKIIYNEKCA